MLSTARLPGEWLPRRFASKSLAEYQPGTPTARRALDAARRLAAGEIRSLVLVGPTGVGKTHLAAGVCRAIADAARAEFDAALRDLPTVGFRQPRRRDHPEWENVADLIVRLRGDMDRPLDDRTGSVRVAELRRHEELVVLDDLGREKVSDWTGETIYALVNERYESMLPTLVTSNLTAAELAASPYWPVISRLAEDGALVEITAPDHRLAPQRERG